MFSILCPQMRRDCTDLHTDWYAETISYQHENTETRRIRDLGDLLSLKLCVLVTDYAVTPYYIIVDCMKRSSLAACLGFPHCYR